MERTLLAVLIDADNVPAKHAEAILKEIASFGEAGLRRVYGDWSNPSIAEWIVRARDLGLVTHQQAANTRGKNASDIGLVIDAMDILHAGKFDGFVLVSSDSDFTRLASRIREEGVAVYGIGEEKTPDSLKNVCNRFIFIENIVKPAQVAAAPEKEKAKPGVSGTADPVQLITNAMDAIDPDNDWFSVGLIGHTLSKLSSDFDSRTFGSAKLSDLLRKLGFDLESRPEKGLWVRRKVTKAKG